MSNSAQIDYPAGLPYGTVAGRFALGYADGTDANAVPDLMPAKATRVVFTPSVNKIVFVGKSGPITIFPQAVECTIDEQGYLTGPDETPGVVLLATSAAGLDPNEWSWTVTFHNPAVAGFSFTLDGGQSLDLATVMPVSDSPGTVTIVSEETAAQVQATLAKLDALIASSQVTAPNLQRHFYEQKVYVPSENVWLFGDREAPPGALDWGTSWASAQGTWDETEKAWRLSAGGIRLTQMSHYAPMPIIPGQTYRIELDIKPDNAGQRAHFTVYATDGSGKNLLSLRDLTAGWNQFSFDYSTTANALDRFTLFFQHSTGSADGGAWFRIRVHSLGRTEYDTPAINTAAGSGYTQYGNFPLRLWRDGNLVQLTGPLVTTDDYASGATLTTLPEWARPDEAEYLNIFRGGDAIILTNGQVKLYGLPKPASGLRLGRLIWRAP